MSRDRNGYRLYLKRSMRKTSEVANLQDLLLFVVRGIAVYNEHLRREGHPSEEADKFIYDALFITITNANFDKAAIIRKIKEGLQLKNELASKVTIANAPDECLWDGNEDEFEEKARTVGVLRTPDEDIRSLKELVHYGLKGMAAYVEHAHNLGYQSPEIFAFMQSALAELTRNDITMEEFGSAYFGNRQARSFRHGTTGCRQYKQLRKSGNIGSESRCPQ